MASFAEGVVAPATAAPRTWPGPRGRWPLGCLPEIRRDQLGFYLRTWRTFGDYVRIRTVPGYDIYLIASPAAVERVLVKNSRNYRKPAFLTGPVRLVAGNGLFSSEGDFWLRQRRLAQPAFLRESVMRLGGPMSAAAGELVDEWQSAPEGRTIDIVPEMMRLTIRIAAATLFGGDIRRDVDALTAGQSAVAAFVSHKMNNPLSAPPWVPTRRNRAFRKAKGVMDRVVLQLIEARRHRGIGDEDLLDRLLAARDEDTGAAMSDRQLHDEILTLLFAGHETTASALSWSLYLLARHPQVQEELHEQVRARVGDRAPAADDLTHLPLATAVFQESLRLYPPAPGLCRQALAPDEIEGYPIPKGALLMPCQWVTHRHPDYWEEPQRFDPGRFLPGRGTERPKFAYFPFGGGPRVCIGNTLALVEGALVLATLAGRFRFQPADDREVAIDTTFVLRPKDPVRLIVRRRP